jgi:hypothetical protein
MANRVRVVAGIVAGIGLSLGPSASSRALGLAPAGAVIHTKAVVMSRASGTFDVKLKPQAADDYADAAILGRMTMDKQFSGDLAGTGKGQMLSAGTSVKDSAGYVAIEKFTGTVGGRSGSFVLQHSGTMTRGTPHLTISVVPDSGTGELAGISGTMTIRITDGKHFYDFDYSLDRTP